MSTPAYLNISKQIVTNYKIYCSFGTDNSHMAIVSTPYSICRKLSEQNLLDTGPMFWCVATKNFTA